MLLFVLGHYLFLKAHTFLGALLSEQMMSMEKYVRIFLHQMENCLCNLYVKSWNYVRCIYSIIAHSEQIINKYVGPTEHRQVLLI